jgi:hypothetical protein
VGGMITPTASLADRCIALGITLFLMYGILMLGWSAGQMLVGVWLQTLVLFVLVVIYRREAGKKKPAHIKLGRAYQQ